MAGSCLTHRCAACIILCLAIHVEAAVHFFCSLMYQESTKHPDMLLGFTCRHLCYQSILSFFPLRQPFLHARLRQQLAMFFHSLHVHSITVSSRFTLSDVSGQNFFARSSSMLSFLSRQLFLVFFLIIFYNFVLIHLLNMSSILLTASCVTLF